MLVLLSRFKCDQQQQKQQKTANMINHYTTKIKKRGEISPVDDYDIQIIGTKTSSNDQLSLIGREFLFHMKVSNMLRLLFLMHYVCL